MQRKIESVEYSNRFLKKISRLAENITDGTTERELLFKEDAFHPSLRTHKLHGKEKNLWAFWINHKYRIKFVFLDAARALFLDIGTHDMYS